MPRQPRLEFPGALYHVMSRGDRREDIFLDDVDRQDFLKTLAEAAHKAGWQIHAYCLMRNHFHLVLETPGGNLVAGMRWLLSAYTIRLNHRHKLFGHVFSGRYKALVVDGAAGGYLKAVCDYVHLNPMRAGLLKAEDRLLSYPWSSLGWYQSARAHRPGWMRVDRLLAEHGLREDNAAGRREFERRMEAQRAIEPDAAALKKIRRGWCLGSEEFKERLLERAETKLGDHHAGAFRQESSEARAERIVASALRKWKWTERDLLERRKSDPKKLELAARLRKETTLTIKQIAQRLHLGTSKSANAKLHQWMRSQAQGIPPARSVAAQNKKSK